VRKSVNMLNESDPATLDRDMELIAISRRERRLKESFMSYIEFLESTSAAFGLSEGRRREKFSIDSPDLLL